MRRNIISPGKIMVPGNEPDNSTPNSVRLTRDRGGNLYKTTTMETVDEHGRLVVERTVEQMPNVKTPEEEEDDDDDEESDSESDSSSTDEAIDL